MRNFHTKRLKWNSYTENWCQLGRKVIKLGPVALQIPSAVTILRESHEIERTVARSDSVLHTCLRLSLLGEEFTTRPSEDSPPQCAYRQEQLW